MFCSRILLLVREGFKGGFLRPGVKILGTRYGCEGKLQRSVAGVLVLIDSVEV